MNYLIYALISLTIQAILTIIVVKKSAKGTLVKLGDIWRLEVDDDLDKLEGKKRIIFNVSDEGGADSYENGTGNENQ